MKLVNIYLIEVLIILIVPGTCNCICVHVHVLAHVRWECLVTRDMAIGNLMINCIIVSLYFSLFLYLIVPGTCNCICVKSCTCVSTCMMGMFDHQGHGYRQFNDTYNYM